MSDAPARRLLALLDDAAPAASLIELSSVLAQRWRRPLEVVYVESAQALLAAALPCAQVLRPGGGQWLPLAPPDVERGYRAQAERLRALVERAAARQAVEWTLRVVRGALAATAVELTARVDLALVGVAATSPLLSYQAVQRVSRGRRSRRVVALVADTSEAGERARRAAEQVAQALDGALEVYEPVVLGRALPRCDVLVLPAALAGPALLARLGQPALLVG